MWSCWKWIRHRINFSYVRIRDHYKHFRTNSHSQFLFFHLQKYNVCAWCVWWLAISYGSSRLAIYTCKQNRRSARAKCKRFAFNLQKKKEKHVSKLLRAFRWVESTHVPFLVNIVATVALVLVDISMIIMDGVTHTLIVKFKLQKRITRRRRSSSKISSCSCVCMCEGMEKYCCIGIWCCDMLDSHTLTHVAMQCMNTAEDI